MVDIDETYVPPVGYTAIDGTELVMKPKTAAFSGNILAWVAPCGRGKSSMVRRFEKAMFGPVGGEPQSKKGRVLIVTINRIYATSALSEQQALVQELHADGANNVAVGSYMTSGIDLSSHQIVLCSFESLHHVAGQRFDVVILDEVSSLARLIGGGTMTSFDNVYLLRELCAEMGTRLMALDADLCFKMDKSELTSVSQDMFAILFPERPVLCGALTAQSTPCHLQRSVQLFFKASEDNAKKCEVDFVNSEQLWWSELKAKVDAWHRDPSIGLIFIPVGTKTFGREVAQWLCYTQKMPVKFYHGDSNQKTRFADLSNTSRSFAGLGAVICTTAIGPGVDIKGPSEGGPAVSCIFGFFDRMGCSFQQQCQSLVRVRHVKDPGMRILIACMPPALRAELVARKKRDPIVRPTYEGELKQLVSRRGAAMRYAAREQQIGGGVPTGVVPWSPPVDGILRVMAHARMERKMQICDPFYAATQLFNHHGWRVIDKGDKDAEEELEVELDQLDIPNLSDDDEFDIGLPVELKWRWVCVQILERGEADFFETACYGLATEEKLRSNTLTSGEQWLVKAYWGLKHVGFLPGLDEVSTDDAEHAEISTDDADHAEFYDIDSGEEEEDDDTDEEGGSTLVSTPPKCVQVLSDLLGNGTDNQSKVSMLKLNAYCRCLGPDEMTKIDYGNRLDPRGKKKDHQLSFAMGRKMRCVEAVGKIVLGGGYRQPRQLMDDDVELSQRFIDVANRFKTKESDDRDVALVGSLRTVMQEMELGGKSDTLVEILRALAKAMGMELVVVDKQTRVNGKRARLVQSMTLFRVLPELVDAWHVWSPTLFEEVRVIEWQEKHDAANLDAVEWHYHRDPDYDDTFVTAYVGSDSRDVRIELIDDEALQLELTKLNRIANGARASLTKQQANQLDTLKAFDTEASKPDDNGIRRLHVTYGKPSGLGRRTASFPSAQHCPSTLRPALFSRWYHDIDMVNCHPTLQKQVVTKMGREHLIPKLIEYVTDRDPMLQRIAAHYGCNPKLAKDCVLRVLNGGSIAEWVKDNNLRPQREQDDLRDLAEEARVIRGVFFAMTEEKEPGMVEKLKAIARSHKMEKAERQMKAAREAEANGRCPSKTPPVSFSNTA